MISPDAAVENVDTSAFDGANSTLIGAYPYGAGTLFQSLTIIANSSVAGSTDPDRSRRFVVQFRSLEPAVGAVYSADDGAGVGVQFYQFEESDKNTAIPKGRIYGSGSGDGGTVTVVARSATSITVRLKDVSLVPTPYVSGLPTTGTVVANGEITAPIVVP